MNNAQHGVRFFHPVHHVIRQWVAGFLDGRKNAKGVSRKGTDHRNHRRCVEIFLPANHNTEPNGSDPVGNLGFRTQLVRSQR